MTRPISTLAAALAVAAGIGATAPLAAWAHRDDDERHERAERTAHDARAGRDGRPRDGRGTPPLPAYEQECGGSCHVAYPPRLLPAESWQRVMSGLERHYGSDASLDTATAKTIAAWLDANASRRARPAPPGDRITASTWFRHEHDEVRAAVWRRASVLSAANCAACHPRAEQGDFDEHDVRIPK